MLPIVVHRASHEPTPEQLKAGNYPKPLRRFAGLRVRVENEAGTVRRGTGPGGVPWETRMLFDYGYVVGSRGTDGDEVDVYLGPHEDAPFAFVIHQRKAGAWDEYDEDKAMLGFASLEDATVAYLQHYDDPRFLGPVTTMPIAEFREKAHASKAAPAMIKSERRLVLLLKATQKHMVMVSGYTKRDGTYVPPHQRPVHWNPDHKFHDIAHGGVTHSQKEAHKKLSGKQWWQGLSVDDKAIHVMALATDIQDGKSASAAVSGWKAAAMAGKNPSPTQWSAFAALSPDKQTDLQAAVHQKVGNVDHLQPPAAAPSKAQAAATSPDLPVPKVDLTPEKAGPDPNWKATATPIKTQPAKPAPAPEVAADPYAEQLKQEAAGDVLADIEANGAYYKKKALAQLKLSPEWSQWDNVTRLDKTNALYKQLQGAASASAAFSGWKKKAAAGKNPSTSEWNGFLAQEPTKMLAALKEAGAKAGGMQHLTAPDGTHGAFALSMKIGDMVTAAESAGKPAAPAPSPAAPAKPPRKVVVTTKPKLTGKAAKLDAIDPAAVQAWIDKATKQEPINNADAAFLDLVDEKSRTAFHKWHTYSTPWGSTTGPTNKHAYVSAAVSSLFGQHNQLCLPDGSFVPIKGSSMEVRKTAVVDPAQVKAAALAKLSGGAAAPATAPAPAPAAAPAAAAAPGSVQAQWDAFAPNAVVPQHLAFAVLEAAGFKLKTHGSGGFYDYEVKKPGGGTMIGTAFLGAALKKDIEWTLAQAKVPLPDLDAVNSSFTGGGSSSGASTPAPAQPSAPAADSGPHDGDTKPGANGGILVFKGGHWHKVNSDVLKNTTPGHDKFWTAIVVGHKLITHYGSNKKILGGATIHEKAFPSHMHAMAALNKLASEKAAGGYKFSHEVTGVQPISLGIGESVGVGSPVVKPAPAAPARAAKESVKPSVKDLVAAVEIPEFSQLADGATSWSLQYAKTAQAAKAAALASGMSGWTDFIKKNKDGTYQVWRPDGKQLNGSLSKNGQHPRQKAMFKFIEQIEAALAGVQPVSASAVFASAIEAAKKKVIVRAPAPAPAPAGGGDVMMEADSWPQTGPQGGFNEGGVFKDPAGQEWYLKFPAGGADVVKNEVLAAALYKAAGCAVPYVTTVKRNGKVGVASLMLPLKKDKAALLAGSAVGLLDGFAVDAWLANWDTVGNNPAAGKGFDNIQFDASGKAIRIDAGGTMNYGGAGGSKTFGDEVIELKTMRDPKKNAHTAQVFGKMTDEQIAASVAKVAALSDTTIRMLVEANGPGSAADKKALADRLIARRDSMVKQYPAATAGSKPKKPFVLNKAEVSTPPDFMSWGTSGKPGPATAVEKNIANAEGVKKLYDLAISSNGDIAAIKALQFPVFDKDASGAWVQVKTTNAEQHPSKWIQGYAQQLINEIEAQKNPPKAFRWDQGHPLAVLDGLHPAVKTAAKHAGTSIGKFLVLGSPGTVSLADLALPEKITYASKKLTTATYSPAAYAAIKKMPSTQRDAVRSYTGSGYQDMNHSLWKGNATGAAKSAAEALHTLGHPIAPGTVLSRKIGVDATTLSMLQKAAGKVLQEPAIMSTSIRPSAWSGNVHMKMHIGPGVKGLWVGKGSQGGNSALSMHGGEDEMILPPNTRLLVLSAKQTSSDDGDGFGSSGSLLMEVVVLPTDEGK